MAQYFYAPKVEQDGTTPAALSWQWEAESSEVLTVLVDGGGTPYVQIGTQGDNSGIGNAFLKIGIDYNGDPIPDAEDVVIRYEFEWGSLNNREGDFRAVARSQAGSITGYVAGPRGENGTEIAYRVVDNARTTLGSQSMPVTPTPNVRYVAEVRVVGSLIESKIWEKAGSEPASYSFSTTDSGITGAGGVGLYSIFPTGFNAKLYYYGIGTNGDPAPTEPVTPGGEGVDIAPSVAETSAESKNPAVASGASVTVTVAITESEANAPAVSAGSSVKPDSVRTESQGLDPGVSTGSSVSPPPAETLEAANDPVVGSVVTIFPPSANTESEALPPSVSTGASVSAPTAESASQASDPSISTGVYLSPPLALTVNISIDPVVDAGVLPFVRKSTLRGTMTRKATVQGTLIRKVRL